MRGRNLFRKTGCFFMIMVIVMTGSGKTIPAKAEDKDMAPESTQTAAEPAHENYEFPVKSGTDAGVREEKDIQSGTGEEEETVQPGAGKARKEADWSGAGEDEKKVTGQSETEEDEKKVADQPGTEEDEKKVADQPGTEVDEKKVADQPETEEDEKKVEDQPGIEDDKEASDQSGTEKNQEKQPGSEAAGHKNGQALSESGEGKTDQDQIKITGFTVREEDIATKEKDKWYAKYDSAKEKTHVTFFVDLSSDVADDVMVSVLADNGSEVNEAEALRETDRRFILDFSGEGTWYFTARISDGSGEIDSANLKEPSSENTIALVISNRQTSIDVTYEGSVCDEEDVVYYDMSARKLEITLTGLPSPFEEDDLPQIRWEVSEGKEPEGSEPVIEDDKCRFSYSLDEEGEYSFVLTCRPKNGRQARIKESFAGGESRQKTGDVYHSKRIIADHTPPRLTEITVKEGGNRRISQNGLDRIYMNNAKEQRLSVSFSLEEEHPADASIIFVSDKMEKAWPVSLSHSDTSTCTCGIQLAMSDLSSLEEGEYRLKAGQITDRAGNVCLLPASVKKYLDRYRIIIDRTCPRIKVSYPSENGRLSDSGRLPENSMELFYDSRKDIRLELSEENVIPGISEENLKLMIRTKKTDEEADYKEVAPESRSFTAGESAATWIYLLSDLPSGESHSYFTVSFEDFSGNPAKDIQDEEGLGRLKGFSEEEGSVYLSPVITVDRTDPVITTSFSDVPSGTLGGRSFYRRPQTMTIKVTDENFDCRTGDGAFFSVRYSTYDFTDRTADQKDGIFHEDWEKGVTWDQGTYIGGKKQYTARLVISDQWNYRLVTEAADLAGRRADRSMDQITVDQAAPYITVTDTENTGRCDVLLEDPDGGGRVSFFDYVRYGYFFKKAVRMKVTAHDDTAGVAGIRYKIDYEDGRSSEGIWQFSGQNGNQTRTILLPADSKADVFLTPVDFGQLSGEKSRPRGSITESGQYHREHAEIDLKISTKPSAVHNQICYYNTPVEAALIMRDPHSGIRSYEYAAGTSLRQKHDYSKKAGTADQKGSPGEEIIYEKRIDLVLPAGRVNYSNAESPTLLSAAFKDHAGHSSMIEKKIVIDDRKPVIGISWAEDPVPVMDRYYNAPRTAVISVEEHNFDESLVRWRMKKQSGVTIGRWRHQGDSHTCQVVFSGDGDDYLLDFSVEDLAGNMAVCPSQKAFTIDRTPPVIRISFDGNEAGKGIYYRTARRASIHVSEEHFRPEDVKVGLAFSSEGKKKDLPVTGKWISDGKDHLLQVYCDKDGQYRIKVSCSDMAGNKSGEYLTERFIIDQTPPDIRIRGVRDHHAYKGTVSPELIYSDVNLDEESVFISLTGSRNGPVRQEEGEGRKIHNGSVVRWEEFRRRPETDDIYTLAVIVKDKAGNISNPGLCTFSVNRFGSNYVLGRETDQLVNGGNPYTKRPVPIEIREINVNKLVRSHVTVNNENNQMETLKEGEDYHVSAVRNKYRWMEYTYYIDASNFSEEGQYEVTVSSVDGASNRMTNVTRNKEIAFTVDRTPPYGRITGLEKKIYKEKEHEISVRADDNYALKDAALYIDGVRTRSWQPEDFEDAAGITEILKERKTAQKVSVKLNDRAGNSRILLPEGNHDPVLISADHFVQFYYYKKLFIGIFLLLAVLITGTAGAVCEWRQRKKRLL